MTWRRLLLPLLLAACGDRAPIRHHDGTDITPGTKEVALGRAFPLTVSRVWSRARGPRPWNDDALLPLAVRLVETTRREDESHVEETRRYDAYAFTLDDVTVSGRTLRVQRALDPAAPGPAELPPPLEAPFPWRWPAAGAAALALAFVLLRLKRRTPAGRPTPPPPPCTDAARPGARALERLAHLRAAELGVQPFYAEATGLLREYLGARYGVPADRMTTEELVAAAPAPEATLRHCDLVRFARGAPDRTGTLDGIERFVEETA